jgi:hypothetical protein
MKTTQIGNFTFYDLEPRSVSNETGQKMQLVLLAIFGSCALALILFL